MQIIKQFFTKADLILMAVIIVVGIGASILLATGQNSGSVVEIKLDGKVCGTYSLSHDREIAIRDGQDRNVVKIYHGSVSMKSANCRNQVCVEHSPISRSGETIVCLPHKVVVTIKGGGGDEYDAISN